jgi:hypothetical protein
MNSLPDRQKFFEDVKKVYHGIAQYLKTNLPLSNSFLRDAQILHPSLKTVRNTDQIVRIGRSVPSLLSDNEIDRLRDEWLAYSIEDTKEEWSIKGNRKDSSGNDHVVYQRIDYYWSQVLALKTTDGRPKYPVLAKLVKNILIISHGNADVERGFSINENIVRENRSLLSESSINGLRSTYDAVHFVGSGSSHKVFTYSLFERKVIFVHQGSGQQRDDQDGSKVICNLQRRISQNKGST